MRRISTGEPSTLATYRKIAVIMRGEDSAAVRFFDKKIAEQGEHEEVVADERQVLFMIASFEDDEPTPAFAAPAT